MKELQATLSPKVAVRPSDGQGREMQGHCCLCRDLKRAASSAGTMSPTIPQQLYRDDALRPRISIRQGRKRLQSRLTWQKWYTFCPGLLTTRYPQHCRLFASLPIKKCLHVP